MVSGRLDIENLKVLFVIYHRSLGIVHLWFLVYYRISVLYLSFKCKGILFDGGKIKWQKKQMPI
jgi:hypothetical protein